MPSRREPLRNGSIYHVFNKTIGKRKIFDYAENCQLFLDTALYYKSIKSSMSFSLFRKLKGVMRQKIEGQLYLPKHFRVQVLVQTLMPNHFHLVLKQEVDEGISQFMANLLNSFTKHLNRRDDSFGPIFLPRFQSVLIKTEEQLMHVSRYSHLNPMSAGIASSLEELEKHKWSSYRTYIGQENDPLIDTKQVLSLFNFNKQRYKNFVESHAKWQRTLELAKHVKKW